MKVLAIPDQHHPWASKPALDWVTAVAKREKPDVIVNLGDALDLYSLSRYPRSHNLYTPAEELRLGMEGYRKHWEALQKAAPKARCVIIDSNHGDRLIKRILERLPEAESLITNPFAVDGVEALERVEFEGVLYEHGYRSKPEDHARHNLQSTVHGHLHTATLHWFNLRGKSRFNLNCGWLGDDGARVFRYRQAAVSHWTLACGMVRDGEPELMVFPFRSSSRRAA
jgi:predicted MPP superfamily phosphohydrolase